LVLRVLGALNPTRPLFLPLSLPRLRFQAEAPAGDGPAAAEPSYHETRQMEV